MFYLIDRHNEKIVSVHRSREAAENADRKLQKDTKKTHGESSYIPTAIYYFPHRTNRFLDVTRGGTCDDSYGEPDYA